MKLQLARGESREPLPYLPENGEKLQKYIKQVVDYATKHVSQVKHSNNRFCLV